MKNQYLRVYGAIALIAWMMLVGVHFSGICPPSNIDGYCHPTTEPRSAGYGEVFFNRVWGNIADEEGSATWGDGAAIYTCGWTKSYGAGKADLALVKWSLSGNLLWYRTWGGPGDDFGTSVWGDGTYVYTCGRTQSSGAGGTDLLLVKWDQSGAVVWAKTWGTSGEEYGSGVWGNGTAVMTSGTTHSFGAGGADFALVVWTTSGDVSWNRTWGGPGDDLGSSVWGNESAIMVCGTTSSYGAGAADMCLVSWSLGGNKIWNNTWGGAGNDYGSSIWGNSSAFVVCGTTGSYGAGGTDITLVTWNVSGNVAWYRTWGGAGNENGNSVWGAGTYRYICGNTTSFGQGGADLVIIGWNASGGQVWNKTWGGSDADAGTGIWSDETYQYTCGKTRSYSSGGADLVIIKWGAKWPPPAPVLQDITPNPNTSGNVTLTWSAVSGATLYKVYRDTKVITKTTGLTPVANGTTTTYVDTGLSSNNYSYVVTALNGNGESDPSNCNSVAVNRGSSGSSKPGGSGTTSVPGYPVAWVIASIIATLFYIRRRKVLREICT